MTGRFPSLPERTLRPRTLLPILFLASMVLPGGCSDEPTTPGSTRVARFSLVTALPEGANSQADLLDAWRVTVSRPGEGVIAEDHGAMAAGVPTVNVELEVELNGVCEVLTIQVELSAAEEVWFRTQTGREVCFNQPNRVPMPQMEWVRPSPTISPGSLEFTVEEGAAATGSFSIQYPGTDGLVWTASVQEAEASWLSLQTSGGTINGGQSTEVGVVVEAGALSPGTYSAHIAVSGEGFPDLLAEIPVSLIVTEKPSIQLEPSTGLSFVVLVGRNPGSQTVTITNSGGGTLDWTASETADWMSLAPTSGSLGAGESETVTVMVASADLELGDYQDLIIFSDPEAKNSPRIVAVDLTVEIGSAPTISNLEWSLRVLNDTTCGNQGSRYDIYFDYFDPDDNLPVVGTDFVGTPIKLEWQFLPEGLSGEALINTGVEGDATSGRAYLDVCIAFQWVGNTSVRETFTLRDELNLWSNSASIEIPRPEGGNAPPGAVSPGGGGEDSMRGTQWVVKK